MEVPEKVEKVKVHKRTTKATNGDKEFTEANYEYNKEEGKLRILVENNKENGMVKWEKNAQDIYVVTYEYEAEENVTEENEIEESEPEEIGIKGTIEIYETEETGENRKIEEEGTIKVEEEIDGIVTNTEIENEEEIYKGKIYTGEDKEYTTNTIINVDYAELVEELRIKENRGMYIEEIKEEEINGETGEKEEKIIEEEKKANIQYKETKISKEEIEKVLGEEWNITIQDQEGNVIGSATNETETDEEGKIKIEYNEGVTKLIIKTSKPENNGIIRIEETKVIKDAGYEREELDNVTKIKDSNTISYGKEGEESNKETKEEEIKIKETETKAKINVDKGMSLTTAEEKQTLQFRITLEANDESKDLYKNPEIKVKLPKQIKEIKAKCKLL